MICIKESCVSILKNQMELCKKLTNVTILYESSWQYEIKIEEVVKMLYELYYEKELKYLRLC